MMLDPADEINMFLTDAASSYLCCYSSYFGSWTVLIVEKETQLKTTWLHSCDEEEKCFTPTDTEPGL